MSLMLRALTLCVAFAFVATPATMSAAQPVPVPVAGPPAPPTATRLQARKAIEHPEPAVRRAAVVRLGEVGTMADADRLVAHLRNDDAPVRELAEAALWQIWSRSGNRAIDALLLRGVQQMEARQLVEAVATFSEVIRKKPAFAEGWNKRATAYYLLGRFELSMHDCDEVLKRNPHHFGALSGYGQMYLALGDPDRAQPYLERALKVNPNMAGVAATIQLIEQRREANRRRTI
ncbi:MAG: tetratricopeptide repeat protein [Polaromonas sp.]|uniref:HEAT repeat domain-containing protein n=1 Tax=Polaromonas sp. TaxID=1869339 RepID=UPI0027368CAE|nr:tetratricopeptide repeat protein [Polaromonas sp.]MDP3798403.1 tetratricopeptide repeat protein [Polaromonas sp.]